MGRPVARWVLRILLLMTFLGGTIYLSGGLPSRATAEHTVLGREIVEALRSAGRGSMVWRLARDQRAISVIGEHPVLGTARWDWWRELGQRPWDLATLLLGQFGLVGLSLAFGSLLLPALGAFRAAGPSLLPKASDPAAPLAIIVLMGLADMLLNSFILYPVILAAGALVPVKSWAKTGGKSGSNKAPRIETRVEAQSSQMRSLLGLMAGVHVNASQASAWRDWGSLRRSSCDRL